MNFKALLPILVASVGFASSLAHSHTPHDDIFDVRVSPNFVEDDRVYAVVRNTFMVSDDGGDTWTRRSNGLDHWSMLYRFDVSGDGSTVYLTSLGNGIFISRDEGDNWRRFNEGLESLVIDLVAVSPDSPDLAFAADTDGALYRTVDGQPWTKLSTDFGKATAIHFYDNHEVLVGDERGGVYRSVDSGVTWQPAFRSSGKQTPIFSLAVSPQETSGGRNIYAGTGDGRLLVVSLGSEKKVNSRPAAGRGALLSIVTAPGPEAKRGYWLFATGWDDGAFRSRDQGMTWDAISNGLTRDHQAPELGRPSFSYLSPSPNFSKDNTVFLAAFDGLFRTDDRGDSWTWRSTLSMENIISLSISPDFKRDSTIIVSTWVWGPYKSSDGGESWTPIVRGLRAHFARRQGLVRPFEVAFSPSFAEDRTLFTSTWYDFFVSHNAGKNWRKASAGWRSNGGGARYADGSYIAVSPDFDADGTIFRATRLGHVLRSEDFGGSFSIVLSTKSNMTGSVITSPKFSEDGVVFVGDRAGVHFSRDGGNSWEYSQLVSDEFIGDIQVSPAYPDEWREAWRDHILKQRDKEFAMKLAISSNFAEDQTVFAALPNGLARSSDGGETWSRLRPEGLVHDGYVETIAVSPQYGDDSTLVISVRGLGTYMSKDGGESFRQIGDDLRERNVLLGHFFGMTPKFASIVFSPEYSKDATLYGFSGATLYRSQDDGETWDQMQMPEITAWTVWRARVIYETRVIRGYLESNARRAVHALRDLVARY